jgi:hypothetical protein
MDRKKKVVNGVHYDAATPDEVIRVLEAARAADTRLHISYGDRVTGRDWLEEFESYGYVGSSTGRTPIPLIVYNRRSMGGGALMSDNIVRIRRSKDGRVLWRHENYHHGTIAISPDRITLPDGRVLNVKVTRDGQEQARFKDVRGARHYCRKLGLEYTEAEIFTEPLALLGA